MFEAAVQALSRLIGMIGDKDTTISSLRAPVSKPSTKKTSKVLEQAGLGATAKGSPPSSARAGPKPGHGRNAAAAYRKARRIAVPHNGLTPGDRCPRCFKGKVGPRPAGDGAGTRTSGSWSRIADGGIGSDNACRSGYGRFAGSLRGV